MRRHEGWLRAHYGNRRRHLGLRAEVGGVLPGPLRLAPILNVLHFSPLAGVGCFLRLLLLLIHDVLAEVLPESSTLKALQVLVKDRPKGPAYRPIPGNLAETRSGTQDMANAIHPCRFPALVVWIHDGDPVVDFLQGQAVVGGRQDRLSDERSV